MQADSAGQGRLGERAPDAPHSHGGAGGRALSWSMAATLGLVALEIVGGTLGRSVALLNDALHNLSDIPVLVISWTAVRWAARPADSEKTYGYQRAGILAAFTNGVLLVVVALGLGYQALVRLRRPVAVSEGWMLWTSLVALAVNGGIALALIRGRRDLNLRSAFVHNLGDAVSSMGILAGALAIRSTGAHWIDPVLGLAIGALVLWSSYGILREAAHILLEGRPAGIRVEEVAHAILKVAGVQEVHDVHVWTLGAGHHALSCHVRIPDMHMNESEDILRAIEERLRRNFRIAHATVQFERAGLPRNGLYMPQPAAPNEGKTLK